jgi:hypothetical protein
MMRTIEVFLVIVIITGAFIIASFYAVLPVPRRVSPLNLRRLALTTLQVLDADYSLSEIVFKNPEDPDYESSWKQLQVALSALLPPNIVYNMSVYIVRKEGGEELYTPLRFISNAESLGIQSEAASYLVASSNVTFRVVPQKIGDVGGVGGTLYILNCSDARGWWITGYTAHTLAQDLYNLLSPYFQKTIMVQNTTQLAKILNGTSLQGETVQGAVIINTFGEAVPIPSGYYATQGYDPQAQSYAKYCHILGQKVRTYNFTWVSIVGYPLYYVSNINLFPNDNNTWGIYGMKLVGPPGLNAFLRGLDGKSYSYNDNWITRDVGVVQLSSEAIYYCNYYGTYPYPRQTATRALNASILTTYNLPESRVVYIFNKVYRNNNWWIPGAVFRHVAAGDNKVTGSFFALGLTRTPDIRLTALGLLCAFRPRLYRSVYTATDATRLVVLQLGQVGGV